MTHADLIAWLLIGAGIVLGAWALSMSKLMPKKSVRVMTPGNLGHALDTLRHPIQLPDGRWVQFQVNAVFHKAAPRRAA